MTRGEGRGEKGDAPRKARCKDFAVCLSTALAMMESGAVRVNLGQDERNDFKLSLRRALAVVNETEGTRP